MIRQLGYYQCIVQPGFRFCAMLLILGTTTTSHHAAEENVNSTGFPLSARLAPPSNEELQKTREWVRKNVPEITEQGPRAVSGLLQLAENAASNAPLRYVLLDEARLLGMRNRNYQEAFLAIEALKKTYRVDAEKLQIDLLRGATRKPADAETTCQISQRALETAWKEADKYRYDASLRLAKMAVTIARTGGATAQVKRAQSALTDLQTLSRQFKQALSAMERIKSNPNNPQAHHIVGHFLCFGKNDFHHGLPHLQKSNDAQLAQIATLELEHDNEPLNQLKLADHWWEYSTRAKGSFGPAMRKHAVSWYGKIQTSQLDGSEKERVLQRLLLWNKPVNAKNAAQLLIDLTSHVWRIDWENGRVWSELAFQPNGKQASYFNQATGDRLRLHARPIKKGIRMDYAKAWFVSFQIDGTTVRCKQISHKSGKTMTTGRATRIGNR